MSFQLLACSTMFESTDPWANTPYEVSKNEAGETVYTRKQYTGPVYHEKTPNYFEQSIRLSEAAAPKKEAVYGLPLPESEVSIEPKDSKDLSLIGGLGLEYAAGDNNQHLGVHIFGSPSEWLQIRGGFSLFLSKDVFAGFDLSVRLMPIDAEVKPFVGLGGYLGDTKKCVRTAFEVETCEKKFLEAGYAELGLSYKNFFLFYRDYSIKRAGLSVPTDYFIGIGANTSWL